MSFRVVISDRAEQDIRGIYDLTDDEKLEIASKRIMKQYKPAFEELAK